MFIVLLRFGVLTIFMASSCLVGCSLVTWKSRFTLPKCICPLLSLNLSSPHYNAIEVLLIVLSGGEFESLSKHMVDCMFGISLEWTCAIFQTQEWERFTFFLKWGSTSLFSSNQFHVLAWRALWFFGGDQVWYRVCGLVLIWKPFPPNFEMFYVLFGVAIDCYSCLWYAMTCLL